MRERERFFAKTRRDERTGCLEWTGSRSRKGYGQFWMNGRNETAPRAAWILQYGSVPAGLHVLHACDNPPCVEVGPGHLFTGTNLDNARDRDRKGRGIASLRFGASNGQARLSPEVVATLRAKRLEGASYAALGREFGVHETTAMRACRGESWTRNG